MKPLQTYMAVRGGAKITVIETRNSYREASCVGKSKEWSSFRSASSQIWNEGKASITITEKLSNLLVSLDVSSFKP